MRIFLLALCCSCGLAESEPVPGIYDVTSTVTKVVCNAQSNTPTVSQLVVEIIPSTGGYTMYLCSQDGTRQVVYATSFDGFAFHGGVNTLNNNGCYFAETWDLEVHYGNGSISGTSNTTLTMPAACNAQSGPCSEQSSFDGTKR